MNENLQVVWAEDWAPVIPLCSESARELKTALHRSIPQKFHPTFRRGV